MSGTPFFTVIIPTFNRADLLAIAIQSVLDQTFTNWELIVVDDGSTDHTASVVKSFGDERIRYYYQENQELNAARNSGVDFSKGKYTAFSTMMIIFSRITWNVFTGILYPEKHP